MFDLKMDARVNETRCRFRTGGDDKKKFSRLINK